MDCPCWVIVISGAFFDPRLKFDTVTSRQRLNFREIDNLPNLQVFIWKIIYGVETEPSPTCSPLNSEQNDVLFRRLDRIFVMYNIPGGNNATLTGEIVQGQTEWKALIDIWNDKETFNRSAGKINHTLGLRTSRNPLKPPIYPLQVIRGQPRSVASDDLQKVKIKCQRSDMVMFWPKTRIMSQFQSWRFYARVFFAYMV